jgi:phage/plasmid-like protein (TIGR03299 family)
MSTMNAAGLDANSILNSAFDGLKLNDSANADVVAELLDKFKLRWDVSKQPLLLPTGEETGFFGVVRTDTMHTFSTCKDSYVPFQNSELAELLIRISEKTGYAIHGGGMFNGGGKVYIQLATGNQIDSIGADRTQVKGFVTGINGHDGTTSLKWGSTNITISCMNTFAAASKALRNSARHTASIHSKVEQSINDIMGVIKAEKSIFEQFIVLSERQVTKAHIAKVVQDITDVDITMSQAMAKDKYSTYAINRSQELLTSIGSEIKAKGESLWGLFSGVTHYTSHVLPVPKRDNARLESKYTGTAMDIDNRAFTLISSLN